MPSNRPNLPFSRPHPGAISVAAALLLGGCSSLESVLGGDKVDYRAQAAKTAPLEVPPDLTQIARDSRYRPQGGVVSANATAATTTATAAASSNVVAPSELGQIRVHRDGQQRWLVLPIAPEALWPQLRGFWQERGFTLDVDSPETGTMETGWAENRAKLPDDIIRNTVGRLFNALYSTGERDRFRTRVERTATGSEVFISHRGLEEVFTNPQKEQTIWRPRASDSQLEAEFLARLMVKLGARDEVAKTAVASAAELPARARAVPAAAGTLEVDDSFDRAWRRVGQALDRSGFTVEDRDRNAGVYFVRYVDPASIGTEDAGFLARLFSRDSKASSAPVKLRVQVKGDEKRSLVTVQNTQGAAEGGEVGQRIVKVLVAELR